MLTGELPLGRFAPPSQKVQVDVRLDEVVLHSLERDRDRRYQNVSEVKTDVISIVSSGAGAAPANLAAAKPGAWDAQFKTATAAMLLLSGLWVGLLAVCILSVVKHWTISQQVYQVEGFIGIGLALALAPMGYWWTSLLSRRNSGASEAEKTRSRRRLIIGYTLLGLLLLAIFNFQSIRAALHLSWSWIGKDPPFALWLQFFLTCVPPYAIMAIGWWAFGGKESKRQVPPAHVVLTALQLTAVLACLPAAYAAGAATLNPAVVMLTFAGVAALAAPAFAASRRWLLNNGFPRTTKGAAGRTLTVVLPVALFIMAVLFAMLMELPWSLALGWGHRSTLVNIIGSLSFIAGIMWLAALVAVQKDYSARSAQWRTQFPDRATLYDRWAAKQQRMMLISMAVSFAIMLCVVAMS